MGWKYIWELDWTSIFTNVLWGIREKENSRMSPTFLIPCFQGLRTVCVSRGQSIIIYNKVLWNADAQKALQ